MSTPAFERFCAGEDRLAAVLRALPAFEPPAHMAEVFAAHVRSLAPTPAPDTMFFEPPATLAAAVAAEAARLHAAQAPRREAALQQIAAGAPSAEVLGAAVGADSERWLVAQAALAARAAQVAEQKAAANTVRQSWWRKLQLVAASTAVAAVITTVATQFILQPDNAEIAVAQFSPAATMLPTESAPLNLAANELASAQAPAARDQARASADRRVDAPAPAKPIAPAADAAANVAADAAANVAAEAATSRRRETEARITREEVALGERAREQKKLAFADTSNAAADDAPKREEPAADSAAAKPGTAQDMAGLPPRPQAEAAPVIAEALPAQTAPAAPAASALAKAAPPPPAVAAAPRMAAIAPAPAAAPAPAPAPAAPAAAAPARAAAQQRSTPAQVFSLDDAPTSVLQKIGGWQSRHRLWVRDPADPATQAWVETLRMAIPEASRPAALPVIGDAGISDAMQVIVVSAPETPAR